MQIEYQANKVRRHLFMVAGAGWAGAGAHRGGAKGPALHRRRRVDRQASGPTRIVRLG